MNATLLTFILLAGLAQTPSATYSYATSGQSVSPARLSVSSQPDVVTGTVFATEDPFLGGPVSNQAQETVLVVPTPDLPAESLADLTEDLAVMCRIFDKALPAGRASTGFAYGDQGDVLFLPFGPQSQRTQGLYLDGYGALFFIPVNYPLLPTEQPEPAQAKPKESTDTVWSQTVKEMSGQSGKEPLTDRSPPAYDAQRVETLNKTLIKTLAHASNIRMRRPQDAITLVVGALDDAGASAYGRYRTMRVAPSKTTPVVPGKPGPRNPARSLLVLRATKADVDALAKGQLMYGDFTNRVQTVWSSIEEGTTTTAPAPPTPGRR